MSQPFQTLRVALCASLLLGLPGCAAPVGMAMMEIGASTGAGVGVSHTLNGITYKTFTAPADDVHTASRKALGTMGIAIDSDQQEPGVRKIGAHANDRDITVEIETVTPRTCRLRVVASESLIFKDSATATEIIMQTSQALDDLQAARPRRTRLSRASNNS
ncbi:MAG TPA: DUF3568 family protein [Magnetospirillum sp.]|jgi:hypothetical protein|nr:DUF3568 family protein [Magnetospirillum sp.]